jgi:predicted O-methyltransferase YrrM
MIPEELHREACQRPLKERKRVVPIRRSDQAVMDGNVHYLYLENLVSILKPKRVVELGTAIGWSASYMMGALPEGSSLTTVELRKYTKEEAAYSKDVVFKEWEDDPRLTRIIGNDLDPKVHGLFSEVDLLFIDTEHTYIQISSEWEIYFPKVIPGGVILLDDIHLNEGMEKFWSEINEQKLDTGRDIHRSGFGLVLKQAVQDTKDNSTRISDLLNCPVQR